MKNLMIVLFITFSGVVYSGVSDAAALKYGKMTQGQYVTGGIVGSSVGFGIGHAIQGRYGDRGWIFTLGKSVGLGLSIAGVAGLSDSNCLNNDDIECESDDLTLTGVGYAMMIGVHIWEVVDVWIRGKNLRQRNLELSKSSVRNSFNFAFVPTMNSNKKIDGLGAGLSFNF